MKLLKYCGLVILSIMSIVYSYQKPMSTEASSTVSITITLEGAFKVNGQVAIYEGMSVAALIDQYGVKDNANMKALDLDHIVHAEESIYLPQTNKKAISLNSASKEELMTLNGVGEKTADNIIAYRKIQPFETLEDIMNVNGIGEKRYEKYRDQLCL